MTAEQLGRFEAAEAADAADEAASADEAADEEPYPAHWEADVVASDGGTVRLRPITPDDAARLVAMHSRLSDRTIYFRFFASYRTLSDRDVERFTHVDHHDRVAFVALLGDDMIGMAMYERINEDEAEVAFVIEDAHQGRGLGSIMLEHLAAAARERGIKRFVAEVLAENRTMLGVFLDAGYAPQREYESGVVHLVFPIEPTETSLEVMRAREHHAEAQSMQRLLAPSSVMVVGASRVEGSVGHTVLVNILSAGFAGPVFVVNPAADAVGGVRSYPSVRDLPRQVDLAVVATPPEAVLDVVRDCARNGVRGLVVLSDVPREHARDLVEMARSNGMRVVGPAALGVANTNPGIRLNATLAPVLPDHGNVGFFAQSDALGIALLASAAARGIGLSAFASAGKKADVSGNDLLQYFEDDPNTGVALLYLERFGNPRKFVRLSRRVGRRLPVVLLYRGCSAVSDAVFGQAGIVRVSSVKEMFDAAAVLSRQPLPAGRRVGVVGNSPVLASLAREACYRAGLAVTESIELE
ncbi:MAG: GNAT family N-acetyltransferase, partial [Frankiaceae bacterium]